MLQVSRAQKMLGDEFGTASNIKNRVNRQSVLGAITSAQQRLKLHNKVSRSRINAGQLVSLRADIYASLMSTFRLLQATQAVQQLQSKRLQGFKVPRDV